MLKILLSTLLLSLALFANVTIEDELAKCEDIYVSCSAKCEEVEDSKSEQCIEKCDKTYYDCESKVIEKFEEKTQN
ncbi:MAG: hypothetical protein WBF48_05295 [Halarcobacter sp.]